MQTADDLATAARRTGHSDPAGSSCTVPQVGVENCGAPSSLASKQSACSAVDEASDSASAGRDNIKGASIYNANLEAAEQEHEECQLGGVCRTGRGSAAQGAAASGETEPPSSGRAGPGDADSALNEPWKDFHGAQLPGHEVDEDLSVLMPGQKKEALRCIVCRHYLAGKCTKGTYCRFKHPSDPHDFDSKSLSKRGSFRNRGKRGAAARDGTAGPSTGTGEQQERRPLFDGFHGPPLPPGERGKYLQKLSQHEQQRRQVLGKESRFGSQGRGGASANVNLGMAPRSFVGGGVTQTEEVNQSTEHAGNFEATRDVLPVEEDSQAASGTGNQGGDNTSRRRGSSRSPLAGNQLRHYHPLYDDQRDAISSEAGSTGEGQVTSSAKAENVGKGMQLEEEQAQDADAPTCLSSTSTSEQPTSHKDKRLFGKQLRHHGGKRPPVESGKPLRGGGPGGLSGATSCEHHPVVGYNRAVVETFQRRQEQSESNSNKNDVAEEELPSTSQRGGGSTEENGGGLALAAPSGRAALQGPDDADRRPKDGGGRTKGKKRGGTRFRRGYYGGGQAYYSKEDEEDFLDCSAEDVLYADGSLRNPLRARDSGRSHPRSGHTHQTQTRSPRGTSELPTHLRQPSHLSRADSAPGGAGESQATSSRRFGYGRYGFDERRAAPGGGHCGVGYSRDRVRHGRDEQHHPSQSPRHFSDHPPGSNTHQRSRGGHYEARRDQSQDHYFRPRERFPDNRGGAWQGDNYGERARGRGAFVDQRDIPRAHGKQLRSGHREGNYHRGHITPGADFDPDPNLCENRSLPPPSTSSYAWDPGQPHPHPVGSPQHAYRSPQQQLRRPATNRGPTPGGSSSCDYYNTPADPDRVRDRAWHYENYRHPHRHDVHRATEQYSSEPSSRSAAAYNHFHAGGKDVMPKGVAERVDVREQHQRTAYRGDTGGGKDVTPKGLVERPDVRDLHQRMGYRGDTSSGSGEAEGDRDVYNINYNSTSWSSSSSCRAPAPTAGGDRERLLPDRAGEDREVVGTPPGLHSTASGSNPHSSLSNIAALEELLLAASDVVAANTATQSTASCNAGGLNLNLKPNLNNTSTSLGGQGQSPAGLGTARSLGREYDHRGPPSQQQQGPQPSRQPGESSAQQEVIVRDLLRRLLEYQRGEHEHLQGGPGGPSPAQMSSPSGFPSSSLGGAGGNSAGHAAGVAGRGTGTAAAVPGHASTGGPEQPPPYHGRPLPPRDARH